MEDNFRVRVDKVFGSLSSSSSPSPSSQTLPSSSLWSLTDDEIQKRQWTREPDASIPADDDDDDDDDIPSNVDQFFFATKDSSMASAKNPNPNPNPNPSSSGLDYREELEDDLKELQDDADADADTGASTSKICSLSEVPKHVGDEEDELEVRNSIGKDCTLDFEEEEDVYDKVAVGSEIIGDRLYMSDVTDYTSHIDSLNELPNTFGEFCRDPRANHLAAKLRLKEDAETAKSFNSLHVSDEAKDDVSDQSIDDISGAQINASEDVNIPKSILKRKDDQMDSKTGKRVRFEPTCNSDDCSASDGDKIVVSEASNVDYTLFNRSPSEQQDSSLVPDYVRHPLRYTHYTFDSSSDMNEESNRQAYTDFLTMVKKSKSEPDEVPADLTKPVIFNPKIKAGDTSVVTSNKNDHTKEITMEERLQKKSFPLTIAAGITEVEEASEMEVDEQETPVLKAQNGRKTARKYRSKYAMESNEPDT